jgi:protease-4
MGLIDDYGTASMVARDIIGAEEIVDYTTKTSYLDRLLQGAGTSIREGLMSMFTTFGLR